MGHEPGIPDCKTGKLSSAPVAKPVVKKQPWPDGTIPNKSALTLSSMPVSVAATDCKFLRSLHGTVTL